MADINLQQLSQVTTAAQSLSGLLLVTPETKGYQPQNPPNPDGTPSQAQQPEAFLFNYEGEQDVILESDITDHYVEDNTARQDQISLKPEIVNTHGFIGELNDVAPFGLGLAKTVTEKLTLVDAYQPGISSTATKNLNTAVSAYQTASNLANSAVSAWSSLTGQEGQNKQQEAFQKFYGYWSSRTLFTIQTPWRVFNNMAIQRLRAIQDEKTRTITDFQIQFKPIRTASILTTANLGPYYSGRSNYQSSSLTNLGTSTPVEGIPVTSAITQTVAS